MQPPALDTRDTKILIQKMKEMIPFYTPEWRFNPDDPDAGGALLYIFTRMLEGTIKRYNQVPLKNLVSFLNMMDASLLPSQPARACLSFRTSASDVEPVLVPGGARAAVDSAGEPLVFETQRDLLVTPANLTAAFTSSGYYDAILEVPLAVLDSSRAREREEYRLFDLYSADNRQQHCFFLGHLDMFNIGEGVQLEILVRHYRRQHSEEDTAAILADPSCTEWAYWGENGWITFDGASARGNRIILKKEKPGYIALQEMQGLSSRWLRCRVLQGQIEKLQYAEFDALDMKARYLATGEDDGLLPDMVFGNDIPLEIEQFYPFGEFFSLYDTFYLASQEAFSRKRQPSPFPLDWGMSEKS